MDIKDIMNKPAPTVSAETNMHDVAQRMLESGNGCVVVVDDQGQATGLLTVRDFVPYDPGNPLNPELARRVFGRSILKHGLQSIYSEARTVKAGRVMRPLDVTLAEDDGVERGVDLMLRNDDTHLPVLRGKKAVGTVSRHDLLKAVLAARPLAVAT